MGFNAARQRLAVNLLASPSGTLSFGTLRSRGSIVVKYCCWLPAVIAAVLLASCGIPASSYASSPVPAGHAPFTPAGTFASRILAAQNAERAAVRLPPLAWDKGLAGGAAAYARQLAVTGTFRHSDRRARAGTGENLWMGTAGGFGPEQMVGNWASEKRWFVRGTFPNVSRTGRWSDVAHYTQIVWPTTTHVGCGLARGGGRDVLVCRYGPAGNIDGRRVL